MLINQILIARALNRAAVSLEYSNPLFTYTTGSLYQFAGGPETSAIHMVADCIGLTMLDNVWGLFMGPATPPSRIINMNEWHATSWTSEIAALAMFRNNKGITGGGGGASRSGLCTETQFYEGAIGRISCDPMTALLVYSSAHGSDDDYVDGHTARWNVELGEAIMGLSLTDANDMVKTLLACDEIRLGNEPVGKKFQEAYDLKTVQPMKDYRNIYMKVTKEIKDILGLKP